MSSPERPRDFRDRIPYRMPGFKDMMKIMATGGFGNMKAQRPLAPQVPRAARGHEPLPSAPANGTRITWAGHSSFVIQTGGKTLLADPVWSESLPGNTRRITPVLPQWDSLPTVDGLLISHNHYDHLDKPTVKRLPRETPCFVPANLGAWFRKLGFTQVTQLDWWETASLGTLRIDFVPAQHWSRRTPFDTNRSLWGGFVLTPPSGGRVYFLGDSGYHPEWFKEIGRRFPGIDVALIPIGAYEPRWFMKPFHMTPEEAVQAFRDVGAKRFIPKHWGTFVLTREALTEPPQRLREAWKAAELAPEALREIAIGETLSFPTP